MLKAKGKTMQKICAAVLAGSLLAGQTAASFAEGAIGNGVYATYDEAYYVNLDYYGNLKDASMVKSYILNGVDSITDYGEYDSVNNLTDGTAPKTSGDAYTFEFGENAPTHFYFEGKTEKPFQQLPWTITVSYKLNGVPTKAEDLAGKTGMVEIDVDAIPNESASEYAKNNYTLEVMSLFNQDSILSLKAEGAQVQLIGNLRAVLFLGLPGEEEHFVIEVGAEDFEFSGLTILMVPANLGALDMVSDLSDKKDDLEDNYHKLDDSLDVLLDSFSDMSAGLREAAAGLDELNEARGIISSEKAGLYDDADLLTDDLKTLTTYTDDLAKNTEALEKMVTDVKSDLTKLNKSVDDMADDLEELDKAMLKVEKDIDDIYKNLGSVSLKNAKKGLALLAEDAEALQEALENFTKTLALLNIQVGGDDITVQGIPLGELDANAQQVRSILDVYDATEKIAPMDNAEMFMVALSAVNAGVTPQESAAALAAQKEQLTQAVTAVIAGSGGYITTQEEAIAYIQANAASNEDFAAIAKALATQQLMETLYASVASASGMSESQFLAAVLMAKTITENGGSAAAASAVISQKAAYLENAEKAIMLVDELDNGVMARMADLLGLTAKVSSQGATDLPSSVNGLIKDSGYSEKNMEKLMDRVHDVLGDTQDTLEALHKLGNTAEDYAPELEDTLKNATTLLNGLSKTGTDAASAIGNFEDVLRRAGTKLDSGTMKALEGLAISLRKLADSTETTNNVKSAKNGITDIVEDVWDDYTGKLNNLLNMDPNAEVQSLTDSRNETPTSIQVLIRTQEIKVEDAGAADEGSGDTVSAAPAEKTSLWSRIADFFRSITVAIASLFV